MVAMRISIIGAGYVGLCTGVGFALKGHNIICVDVDKKKIDKINAKKPPITESGLEDALKKTARLIKATTDLKYGVNNSSITFICVGTPSRNDNHVDTSYVENVSKQIGSIIKDKKGFHVIVIKSSVIPGTTEEIIVPIMEKFSHKKSGKDFGVCSNPEFLREGSAINDFLYPDRIVIGVSDEKTKSVVKALYRDFNAYVMITSVKTAEMVKYASNAFLAAKISLINEIGNICKKLGIDTYDVARGVGYDKRIGDMFLSAGVGFGGSCLSKDINALYSKAKQLGYEAGILDSILKLNKYQRVTIVDILRNKIPNLDGKTIAVLGLAFKANTDDIRDSPAIDVVSELKKNKCKIVAYDPKASKNFKKIYSYIKYAKSCSDALDGADACLILTEWDEFKNLTDKDFSVMRNSIIIEGRKVLNKDKVKNFEGVCW